MKFRKIIALSLALLTVMTVFGACTTPITPPERGTWDGNVYTNEFAGFKFTVPEDWTICTDEQLVDILDIAADYLDSSKYETEAIKQRSIYDMMSINNTTGANIIVLYENLSLFANLTMSEDAYLDTVKEQLADPDMGYTFGEYTDVTISGQTYRACTASTTTNGVEIAQSYYIRKVDGYMVCLIFTNIDNPLEMLS